MNLRRAAIGLLLVVGVGCGGTDLTTAVKPAQDRTVNRTTDTLEVPAMPPVPEYGVPTEPTTVRVYADTLPAPELEVQRITANNCSSPPSVDLVYRVGDETRNASFKWPAKGECLDIRAATDTANDPTAQVRGTPKADTVKVRVRDEDDGFFADLWDTLAWIGLLSILGHTLYLLRGFIPKLSLT